MRTNAERLDERYGGQAARHLVHVHRVQLVDRHVEELHRGPCNIRREGGHSLVLLEGKEGIPLYDFPLYD